jgi:hypothetical protein
MNILCKGFNIDSLLLKFNPKHLKQIQEAKQRKKDEAEKKKLSAQEALDLMREAPTEQQKLPPEDFENPKLSSILQEAYTLYMELDQRRSKAEKKIKEIEQAKKKMIEQKTQTLKATLDPQTKVLFKTIMCALGEQCPKLRRQRWPDSALKSVTNFGSLCPFAHHLMELEFPATLSSKIAAAESMKKQIKKSIDVDKPQKPFVPPSAHIDKLPKELSQAELKAKNEKLMKLMKKREGAEIAEYLKEMEDIKSKLEVDDNYCKKFGMLKKASVLMFYGRENEAFNEIAKAVKIV